MNALPLPPSPPPRRSCPACLARAPGPPCGPLRLQQQRRQQTQPCTVSAASIAGWCRGAGQLGCCACLDPISPPTHWAPLRHPEAARSLSAALFSAPQVRCRRSQAWRFPALRCRRMWRLSSGARGPAPWPPLGRCRQSSRSGLARPTGLIYPPEQANLCPAAALHSTHGTARAGYPAVGSCSPGVSLEQRIA